MKQPAGAGPLPRDVSRCRAGDCGADIVWLKTKAGRPMPVNVVPTNKLYRGPNAGETEFVYGEHESHFSTCPAATSFRKQRK